MATTIFLVNPQTFPSSTSYLLDTYTAAAAYSLRQLKTGVTNVVRVRRASDNAESDFTATDITDGTLVAWTGANDGFVVTWYDQSGGGNDVTQATAGNQPQLVSSGSVLTKGSIAGIKFDGTNDYIKTGSALGALQSYPFSIFAVGSNEASGVNGLLLAQRNASGDASGINMQYDRSASAGAFNVDNGPSSNIFNYLAQINNANQRLQTFTIDGSGNGELWKDGTSQESIASIGAFATTPTNAFEVGRQQLGSAYLNGYVQEVILFNTDESANRTDIESDINTYYSIY